jgi:hypothetical protein
MSSSEVLSDLFQSSAPSIPITVSNGAEPSVADLANAISQEWDDQLEVVSRSIEKTTTGLRNTAKAAQETEESALRVVKRLTAAFQG